MEHKVVAIVLSLLILLLAAGIRVLAGTLLIPAGIFALCWFCFTIVPLVFLFSVPINSLAILYILTAVFAFSLSAVPFHWKAALRRNESKSLEAVHFDSAFLRLTLYVCFAMSIALSIATLASNGFSLDVLLSDVIVASGHYAAIRGNVGMQYGFLELLGTMFTYLCPVLGGLRVFADSRRWFFYLSMAPSLLTMVTQSSKLVFLVSLCFYFAGALIARIHAKEMKLPRVSLGPRAVAGSLILLMLVLVSFVSRLGKLDMGNLGAIAEPLSFSVSSYTVGQVYAFADFFSYTIGSSSTSIFKEDYHSYGAYTFASIFDMLGVGKDFPPGMFEETGWYAKVYETNIFTVFRGLIYDFGVVGSLVFLFLFGLGCHAVAYEVITRRRAWLASSALMVVVVFILMGYLFSVFVARYVFLIGAVTWLLLRINTILNRDHLAEVLRLRAES